MTALVVQAKCQAFAGTVDVVLDAAPTEGNLLVAIATSPEFTAPAASANWTRKYSGVRAGSWHTTPHVYTKIAGAGESATQTPHTANGHSFVAMFEVSGAVEADLQAYDGDEFTTTAGYDADKATLTTVGTSLMLFGVGVEGTYGGANIPSAISGLATLVAGANTGGGWAAGRGAYSEGVADSTAVTAAITWGADNLYNGAVLVAIDSASPLPGDISDLAAAAVDDTSVALTFTPASGATSHESRYSLAGVGSWSSPAAIADGGGTVSGLTPETAYDFQVRGVNGAGNGNWSNTATETTLVVPGDISDLEANVIDDVSIDITFTPASNATSHEERHALAGSGNWSTPIVIADGGGTVSGLLVATAYDFQVRGVNGVGDGNWSNTATETTNTLSISIVAYDDTGSSFATVPAGVKKGDLIVLYDVRSVVGAVADDAVIPTWFTEVSNGAVEGGSTSKRSVMSAKIANGREAGYHVYGILYSRKLLVLYRLSAGSFRSFDVLDTDAEGVVGNPAPQTVSSATGPAPVLILAGYNSNGIVDPRNMTPVANGEVSRNDGSGDRMYIKHRFYVTNPQDVVVDMDDEGSRNVLQSAYLALTLGDPVEPALIRNVPYSYGYGFGFGLHVGSN